MLKAVVIVRVVDQLITLIKCFVVVVVIIIVAVNIMLFISLTLRVWCQENAQAVSNRPGHTHT